MGGRGSSSSGAGGGLPSAFLGSYGGLGSFKDLVNAANNNQNNMKNGTPGGYTDEDNPNLLKYQQQDPDKLANFLAGTDRKVDLNDPQYQDGYPYHDLPLNRLLARLGINKGPTVLNEKEFNQYCQQTGQQAMFRGWSSTFSAERFMNTTNNHVGNGRLGDGYYFSPNLSTARVFAGGMGNDIMPVALSPKANAIDIHTLRSMMSREPQRLQTALYRAGHGGSGRTFGANNGEAQYALMKGYNVITSGDYCSAVTNDALVVCNKLRS